MLKILTIGFACLFTTSMAQNQTNATLKNLKQDLIQHSAKQNLEKVQASLSEQSEKESEGIPTQKSAYKIYLDWQKPNKCVDVIATTLKPHYSWRLLQNGRDLAIYRVPRSQAEQVIQSLKNLAPLKVFVENSNVSYDIVYNASRYVAIDTLSQYYYQAIEESEQAIVVSELAEALDQLENERNKVIQDYLSLRLDVQSAELHIECTPFAPPVEGEAKVAVPWLDQIGVSNLEREF